MAGEPPCGWNSTEQSAGMRCAHESAESLADLGRVLLVDQAERYFRRGFRRDDRLEALAGIAARNAVELGGRPRPDHAPARSGPVSPAGTDRPTGPRKVSAVSPSASQDFSTCDGVSSTPS